MHFHKKQIEADGFEVSPALDVKLKRRGSGPQVRTAEKRSFISHEGDVATFLLLLLDGWVALTKALPDGETQIIDLLLPGDSALIAAQRAPISACSVEALTHAKFVTLGEEILGGTDAEDAAIRRRLVATLSTAQARVAEHLLRSGRGSAASRIAYALLELYVRLQAVGMTWETSFALPMTQQDIGQFTGLSNVHVCRTLRRFEQDGIVAHRHGTDIALHDIHALCTLAGVNLDQLRSKILIRGAF
ncbi:Crp/Fnr family transcriptional regulator [Celeribacter indicus]|uniref:Transcriptional regulator n=1 Tax=Celeribacter indicus TaxID=1208324 RepID=A0A0B5DYA6_9RHOB|nr:Crp/Fnr family transcriptional regulator [Celeribacter indicus]AJE48438.1 transcriptional regulator [Celeribacter indicus]SDX29331.1 cAMP-binding domain of CRP or a regulatory subunit of cAMP-dependent protein kinases [Celeribacter indicus]